MIIYDLCCEQDHRFEGWFRDADDFSRQLARGLITCPQCDSHLVRRIPSAVAIAGKASQAPVRSSASSASSAPPPASPSQLRALYWQAVQQLMSQSEDVGSSFADEARRIHYHEVPERAIHGQATPDEVESLHDEGIPVLPLPVVRDDDLN